MTEQMHGVVLPGGSRVEHVSVPATSPGQEQGQRQVSLHGWWVTSVSHMRQLLTLLDRSGLHPEDVVSDRFTLADAAAAYATADRGSMGKVCIVWD